MFFNKSAALALVAIFSVVTPGVPEVGRDKKSEFDAVRVREHVKKIMERIPTSPAVAVAVVKGDKVLFSEGFGYRNLEKKLRTNAQTGFYLASTTKSFTAATAKILAEEGKLDLDVPIKTYFPDLKMKPPHSEDQLTLRDMLTHRSGIRNLGIGRRTSYSGQYDRDTIVRLLNQYSTPRTPAYRYTNLGYVVTGFAINKVTGKSWKEVTREKLFDPIGMNNTTSYASKALASGNYAVPYRSSPTGHTPLPYKNDATMHAAGGTVSSVEDMAKWLIVMMNNGRFGGKQIISKRSMREILAPQINQNRSFYTYKRYSYGLGWNIATYKGEEFIHCFGTYAGFRPHTSFMPEHGIGIVVLINDSAESIILPDMIANEIYDYMLGKSNLEFPSKAILDYEKNLGRMRERVASQAANVKQTQVKLETANLRSFTGNYSNDQYGDVTVTLEGNKLRLVMGNLRGYLEARGKKSFSVDFGVLRPITLSFENPKQGKTSELRFGGEIYKRVG